MFCPWMRNLCPHATPLPVQVVFPRCALCSSGYPLRILHSSELVCRDIVSSLWSAKIWCPNENLTNFINPE